MNTRKGPSHATKMRYHDARKKLGYAKSNNYIDWDRLAKRTTFAWKFPTLRETIPWVWQSSTDDFVEHPEAPRSDIVMHYVSKAFGVAVSDLLDDHRNIAVHVPRAIAICTLKLSGMSVNEIARQMARDAASIRTAVKNYQHLFEGLTHGVVIEPTDNIGLAPDGPAEQGGPSPS